FMSPSYLPRQRKVFPPGSTTRPDVSTPRDASICLCSSGKSSPTTPTRFTGVKKLAAYEKYVAEPPSAFSATPKGVSTVSRAIEPTTSNDMQGISAGAFEGEEGGAVGLLRRTT